MQSTTDNTYWLKQRLIWPDDGVKPSSAAITGFLNQLTQFPFRPNLVGLATSAIFRVISTQHPGAVVRHAVETREPDARAPAIELECPDNRRGMTLYHLVSRRITLATLGRAARRMSKTLNRPAWYVVVTPGLMHSKPHQIQQRLYEMSDGVEFRVFDCHGFLNHFLDLYHQHRTELLEQYQTLVLGEPDSAVSFALKQAFLALLAAAHSPEDTGA